MGDKTKTAKENQRKPKQAIDKIYEPFVKVLN